MAERTDRTRQWTILGSVVGLLSLLLALVAYFWPPNSEETTEAKEGQIVLPDTTSPAFASTTPTREGRRFVVPVSKERCEVHVDLDEPRVYDSGPPQQGGVVHELRVDDCTEGGPTAVEFNGSAALYGIGPKPSVVPTQASACIEAIQYQGFAAKTIWSYNGDPGTAYCVITKSDSARNVVWFEIDEINRRTGEIVLEYMKWPLPD